MRATKTVDDQDVDEFVRDIAQALPQNLKDKIEFKDPKALSKKEAQNLAARVLLGCARRG